MLLRDHDKLLSVEDIVPFYAKVIKTSSCWLWKDSRPDEYGSYRTKLRAAVPAHRASYYLEYGVLPNDKMVCHTCDIKACVRPDHLFLGTGADNSQDCVAKGRRPARNKGYREYTETIGGKLYGAANIPLGDGKYKKIRKRVANRTEARQWAQEQLAKASPHTGPDMSFNELTTWYKDEHIVAPVYKDGKKLYGLRTWRSVRRQAEALAETFGEFLLDELTVDVLTKYKRKQLATVSITTTNRRFALLRSMFKKAKQRKWMIENPFDVDPALIEVALENKRQSGLNDHNVKRLLARARKSSQPLLYPVLLTLAHTGARPSEIYPYEANDKSVQREPLTWDRVTANDFKTIELVSYKGRVRQTRVVPVSTSLEAGLRELHDRLSPVSSDLVFPITTFKRSWRTLCTSVGVSNVRMRDFRHYFNSYLVSRSDINDMERMLILGHTGLATNVRYSRLDKGIVERFRNG